jgi:hypothetical protein
MWIAAELVIRNYQPEQLEKGMLFLNILHPGTHKETYEIFSLDRVPRDEEAFIALNGFPIEFSIICDEKEIVKHSEIGWFDFGEKVEFLTEISLKEINIILNEFDGWLDVEIDDESYELYDLFVPTLNEGKALLRFYEEEEYDDEEMEEDFLDEWEDDMED